MSPSTAQDKEGFHTDFNDSTADMIIECQDGVKFKVHSYLLMAHCEYFRNMPSHSDQVVADSPKLIHLDCASPDLALLLKLINKSSRAAPYIWSELSKIVKLGARYHFIHVPDIVHQPASHCISHMNALEIFQFASANQFPDLAKAALVDFASSHYGYYNYNEIGHAFFDEVSPRYAAALVVAMAPHMHTNNAGSPARWQRISAAFKVC